MLFNIGDNNWIRKKHNDWENYIKCGTIRSQYMNFHRKDKNFQCILYYNYNKDLCVLQFKSSWYPLDIIITQGALCVCEYKKGKVLPVERFENELNSKNLFNV